MAIQWMFCSDSRERNERLTLRIVGVCFVALAVYITFEAASDLIKRTSPEHGILGIVLACVSLVVMPFFLGLRSESGLSLGAGQCTPMRSRQIFAFIYPPSCWSALWSMPL